MAYENHLIDKRVVERNIAKGLVDPAVLKQQIASLPDAESNLVHVSVDNSNTAEQDRGDIYDDVDDLDEDEDEENDVDVDDQDDEDDDEDDADDAAADTGNDDKGNE